MTKKYEEYEDIINPKDTSKDEPNNESNSKWDQALKRAWDTRTFEIETLWKRTNYFSIMVGALFVGYNNVNKDMVVSKFVIILLGFVASLIWFFINKGSKFWQEKWEIDINQIEKAMDTNKLHSNVFTYKNKHCAFHPTRTYPFSVSKLNMLFSCFITCAWGLLFIYESYIYFNCAWITTNGLFIILLIALIGSVFLIIWLGKSSFADKNSEEIAGQEDTKEENKIYHYKD